jgi:hypothetical protein
MENKDTYLYVLLLPHMDEEYNLGYVIKFGYTEDFDQRIKTGYNAYYDFTSILHVYKGEFNKDDEFAIKQYLKEYCLFKEEWFKCCQEVLGFFNTYDTSEKLKQKILEIPVMRKSEPKYHSVNYMLIDYLIQTYYNDIQDILKIQNKRIELEAILREYTEINQYNYLKEKYKFELNYFKKYREERVLSNSNDKQLLKRVEEFNEIKRVNDKIRFLVEYSEKAEKKNFDNLLELIPGKYKDYFQIVGLDIIKAYGCEEYKIKKAWTEKIMNQEVKDDVDLEIYGSFTIGKRYSNKHVKDILNELYQKLGYKKKAKTTDLEVYYAMKAVKFQDTDGKWINGLEIIGKK